jgi:hypothetical protein
VKRGTAGVLVLVLGALILAPAPAGAHGRYWSGLAVGGLAGLIIGGALAAPHYAPPPAVYPYPAPPAYVGPPPVYPPAPGYPASAPVYVPPQSVWNGYQWVWQPGHWRYQ